MGRVKDVLSKAAICLFAESYRNKTAGECYPGGNCGGKQRAKRMPVSNALRLPEKVLF